MSATLPEFGDAAVWQTPLQEVYPHDDESPDLDTNKCGESLDLAHIHILVFEKCPFSDQKNGTSSGQIKILRPLL